MLSIIEVTVAIFAIYLLIGVAFAIAFAVRGVGMVDPVARQGSLGFRLLIIPGAAALWPLLLKRWISRTTHPPAERNAHRAQAQPRAR